MKNKLNIVLLLTSLAATDASAGWFSWANPYNWHLGKKQETPLTVEPKPSESSAPQQEKPYEFDFSKLGLRLLPKNAPQFQGTEKMRSDLCRRYLGASAKEGIIFFVSWYQHFEDEARRFLEGRPISNLERKAAEMTTHEDNRVRHIVLQNAPVPFLGKLLKDIREKSGKDELYHWGAYEIYSGYYDKPILHHYAKISGAYVAAQYISFFFYYFDEKLDFSSVAYSTLSEPEKTKLAFQLIEKRIAKILEALNTLPTETIKSLLYYSDEDSSVKLGLEHHECLGELVANGECIATHHRASSNLALWNQFQLLNAGDNRYKQILVDILDQERNSNPARFELFLKALGAQFTVNLFSNSDLKISEDLWKAAEEVLPNFSEERTNAFLLALPEAESETSSQSDSPSTSSTESKQGSPREPSNTGTEAMHQDL